jgi:hypothetical protein
LRLLNGGGELTCYCSVHYMHCAGVSSCTPMSAEAQCSSACIAETGLYLLLLCTAHMQTLCSLGLTVISNAAASMLVSDHALVLLMHLGSSTSGAVHMLAACNLSHGRMV